MKRLVTVALLVIALAAIASPSARNHQESQTKKDQSKTASSPPTAAVPALPVTSHVSESATVVQQVSPQAQSKNWHEWFWPPIWSNWALVLVGAGGVGVALRTLKNIEAAGKQTDRIIEQASKQAESARIAAEATEKSAQALMNGDRAWLLVDDVQLPPEGLTFLDAELVAGHSPPQRTYFTIRFRNFGKTPAVIYGKEMRFSISDSSHEPPRTDIYGAYRLSEYRHIVPQDMSGGSATPGPHFWIEVAFLEPTYWLNHQQFTDVNNMAAFLWAYGVVKYLDVYGRDHETRFCYRYDVPPIVPEDYSHFCLAGEREYNKAT